MNPADLAAMPGEAEDTPSVAQTPTPALLPFQDWMERERPSDEDPMEKFRGYSGYARQALLEQGCD